jgi:ribosomal protein L40E
MGCWCEWRAPPALRFVLPAIILWLIGYLYLSFVWFAQPRVAARGGSRVELAAFHLMTALLCWSLAQCLRSNDSFVRRSGLRKIDADAGQLRAEGPPLVESKMDGSRRVCRKCRALKPDRAHHCSSCRRCVLKMDHHCVYINKCIGFYNYKFFLLFLGWSAATCLYESSLLFRYLLMDCLERATTLYLLGELGLWTPELQIVLVFFGSTCVGAALLCFYVMHLVFTAFNYTTLEYCEKRGDPDFVNYFNVGVARNFQQIFGSFRECAYWFVPLHSPSVLAMRGQFFPVNRKFRKDE